MRPVQIVICSHRKHEKCGTSCHHSREHPVVETDEGIPCDQPSRCPDTRNKCRCIPPNEEETE